jgi:elongation factor G
MSEFKASNHPIISVAVSPKLSDNLAQLQRALSALVREDPSLRAATESPEGQMVLSGMSDSHLESVCERISREYEVPLNVGEFKLIYLETIRRTAEGEGKYIRQTGGAGNYGHCKIRVIPKEAGGGCEFVNEIKGNVIPDIFIGPIDHGIREALENGILFGYPVVDLTVILFEGSYHATDSNETAFRFAGSIAVKEAARRASPVLLEPVMALEIGAPEECVGMIIRDINSRRGRIEGVENAVGSTVVRAKAPLAEMLGYAEDIRSMTQGRASHSLQFTGYEAAPRHGEPGSEGAGVTANKPYGPKSRTGSVAAKLDAESATDT